MVDPGIFLALTGTVVTVCATALIKVFHPLHVRMHCCCMYLAAHGCMLTCAVHSCSRHSVSSATQSCDIEKAKVPAKDKSRSS